MRPRNQDGQYINDQTSNKGRILALIEQGETCRKRMGEATGISQAQVRSSLCNLVNTKKIEIDPEKPRVEYLIYRIATEPKKVSTFARVNSVFALASM